MADQGAGKVEKGFVDIRAGVGAQAQAAELMQPTEGAFHRPAQLAQAAAVRIAWTRGDQADAPASQRQAMQPRTVRPIPLRAQRPPHGPAYLTGNRRNRRHQGQQLRYVVGVGPGEGEGQRHAGASVIRWCLEPNLRRSVGLGPVCWPPQGRGPRRNPPGPATSRSGRRREDG